MYVDMTHACFGFFKRNFLLLSSGVTSVSVSVFALEANDTKCCFKYD